jgi:hypothetical protein
LKKNPLVRKISLLTAGLTKPQLDTLLAQVKARDLAQLITWFENENNTDEPLTIFEIEQLQGNHHPAYRAIPVVNWLIGEWLVAEKAAIIADHMRQARIDSEAALKIKVTDWLTMTKGVSTDTANRLYSECYAILEAE